MTQPALTAEDLLAWVETTSSRWRALVAAHPEILTMPCDVAKVTTAGALLRHVVAVELRYAERLAGLPATDYEAIPFDSSEAIYSTHDRATALFREQLSSEVDWDERIEFMTRTMGPASSTRKTVVFHALLHSIRHYAQLATLVRQHGVQPGWPMDYLFMNVARAPAPPAT